MLLPALAAAKRKAQRINCVNNLKEVGLAFRVWEGDNNDQYPMAVSSAQGGAREYVAQGNAAATALNPGMVFMVMSNELSTPKILYCTSDSLHSTFATNFAYMDLLAVRLLQILRLRLPHKEPPSAKSAISSTATRPKVIRRPSWTAIVILVTTTQPPPVLRRIRLTKQALPLREMLLNRYNITSAIMPALLDIGLGQWICTKRLATSGIADGSVQQTTISGLHTALLNSTNTVAAPYINIPN